MEVELGKNYSLNELVEAFGPEWRQVLGLHRIPIVKNKPEIFSFDDFNDKDKEIYLKILSCVTEHNNEPISVYAYGSRITGTWKTREEAEQMSVKYGLKRVKYSDYDFVTDAKVLPPNSDISQCVGEGVVVDGFKVANLDDTSKLFSRKVLVYRK